ncbi:MAG: hypothetical protein QOG04_850 [Actinomycetota bacterium]|nr:hypothetical protein [Actinomycetota bacterium]
MLVCLVPCQIESQLVEEMSWLRDQSSAARTDEFIRADRHGIPRASWDRKDRSTSIERDTSSDQGPALQTPFDHQDPFSQADDDPVPSGEMPRVGLSSVWIFRDDRSAGSDLASQREVLFQVRNIQPATKHRNRVSATIQGTTVGGSVDPQREAGDNRDACFGQRLPKLESDLETRHSGPTRSHDRYRAVRIWQWSTHRIELLDRGGRTDVGQVFVPLRVSGRDLAKSVVTGQDSARLLASEDPTPDRCAPRSRLGRPRGRRWS